MKYLNDWLPWISLVVMFVAGKIASYYTYAKQNDPTMAEKIKHIGELATWAVSYQSKFTDKSGANKFHDAVNAVMVQTPSGIDRDTVKGAVEHAYMNMEKEGNNNA